MLCKNSQIAVSEQIFSMNLKKIMSFDHRIMAQKKSRSIFPYRMSNAIKIYW